MKQLYQANLDRFLNVDLPGVAKWKELWKIIPLNVSLVDRTGHIEFPYNFKIYSGLEMPALDKTFNLSYEDCCNERAKELVSLSDQYKKPIKVLYSGGIDSTLVLISLMKCIPADQIRDQVTVSISANSIVENPNFYYNYIRNTFNLESSNKISSCIDGTHIVVTGEHNDQLFGSDLMAEIMRHPKFSKEIYSKYTRQFIVSWLVHKGMTPSAATTWFDLIDDQIKRQAECEVTTNFHFFWWINFCFKWQTVFFRIIARTSQQLQQPIDSCAINTWLHHFYSAENFQQWSMLNHDKKILVDWNSYKYEAKKVIYNFNHDAEYRDYKVKIGSLYNLFLQTKIPEVIDTDLNFVKFGSFDPVEYHNPSNSFI
jgi:hypothetical protein